jgi:hypothetical protein
VLLRTAAPKRRTKLLAYYNVGAPFAGVPRALVSALPDLFTLGLP